MIKSLPERRFNPALVQITSRYMTADVCPADLRMVLRKAAVPSLAVSHW